MLTREIHSFFSVFSSPAEELGSRLQAGRSVGQGRAASPPSTATTILGAYISTGSPSAGSHHFPF